MRPLIFALPLLVSLAACGEEVKEDTTPPQDTQPVDDGMIGFADDVLPLLETYCSRCHGAGQTHGGVDVTSYESLMASGVVVASDSAASQLVTIGSHHGSGWFSAEDLATVTSWIDAGALND